MADNNNNGFDATQFTDVGGVIASAGHNLVGEIDGSTGWTATDLTGTLAHPLNAKLSPLGFYGGITQTLYPLPGSPALGAGSLSLIPNGVTTDQRGFPRVVGGKVEIGAVELNPAAHLMLPRRGIKVSVAGVDTAIQLGSFTDAGGQGPFTVEINWGDGSPDSMDIVNSPGSLGTVVHAFTNTGGAHRHASRGGRAGSISNTVSFGVSSVVAPSITYVVNTTSDQTDPLASNTVSLRDAINRMNAHYGPTTITFDPKVFATAKTIALAGGNLEVSNHFGLITLTGPAAGVTVKAAAASDIFTIDAQVTAKFSGLTLTGGTLSGIHNAGTLTLSSSTLSGNTDNLLATGYSTGYNGGAIDNTGTLTLINSTISGNSSAAGGGVYNSGTLTLMGTTVAANHALNNHGFFSYNGAGGGIYNDGTLTLIDSTVANNSADTNGGGISNTSGTLTLTASTVSGNTAGNDGGGVYSPGGAVVTMGDSIIAANNAPTGSSADIHGQVTSFGHNLIGEVVNSSGWVASDLTGAPGQLLDPKLSPLGNYGGPTPTMLPLQGSPALRNGSLSLIAKGVTTDQRGFPRAIGGKVDIGATEVDRRGPFTGIPAPFGRIQAENFDLGGQGAGYYNPTNLNRGGLYRPTEGVGIGAIPASQGGGYFAGYTLAGESLNYTVKVAATGTYTLNFRVSSTPKGGTFHLNVDGKNVTGSLSIPDTGSFDVYQIVSKGGISLTAGTHVLQLVIDTVGSIGAAGNFDWFEAVKV